MILTLTPPMTLHTRPTVTLFYCRHDPDPNPSNDPDPNPSNDPDPDPSNDPTHQARLTPACHPVLLPS